MDDISLHDHARHIARRTGLRIAVAISTLILSLSACGVYAHYVNYVNAIILGQVKNFSFWTQVNDRFQLQRSISTLIDNNGIAAMQIVDRNDSVIASKANAIAKTAVQIERPWTLSSGNLLLKRSFSLYEAGEGDLPSIGTLSVIIAIPLYLILLAVLILGLASYLFIRVFENQMVTWITTLTQPVQEFANLAERTESLADLSTQLSKKSSFKELNILGSRFRQMAERLVRQEAAFQNAERSNALVALSTQVAHDIRSPLSALRIAMQTSKNLEPERKRLAIAAAERIEKIAEDLLMKYRTRNVMPVPSDVVSACNQIIQEKSALEPSLKIKLTVKPDRPAIYASVHEVNFDRILSNIVNNSVEAMGSDGGELRIQITQREDMIELAVEDDGPGFSDAQIASFERGSMVSSKKSGNGLALNNAKKLINDWGGSIELLSSESSGARVFMRLPIAEGL